MAEGSGSVLAMMFLLGSPCEGVRLRCVYRSSPAALLFIRVSGFFMQVNCS